MNFMLILWVATLGLERVDFLNGTGDFKLSPFIVLSPLVLLSALPRISQSHTSPLSIKRFKKAGIFISLILLFIIIIGLSVTFSNNIELSSKRYVLLLYIITFTVFNSIFIFQQDYKRILLKGSLAGLLLYVGFSLLQIINWLAKYHGILPVIDLPFIDLAPFSLAFYAPRNSGLALDPNRGCFLMIIYWFIIFTLCDSRRYRKLVTIVATILCISAISITGTIMFMSVSLILLWREKESSLKIANITRWLLLGAIIGSICLVSFTKISQYMDFYSLVEAKFSFEKGSSNESHLIVLKRAIEVFSDSLKNIFLGNGYGASQNVLSDFFGNNKYANFHSAYASFLAESGFISLLLFLFILLSPIWFNSVLRPLLCGIALFNVFYQTYLDPIFWFCIVISWFYEGSLVSFPQSSIYGKRNNLLQDGFVTVKTSIK